MSLPTFLEPENARVTIPLVLAAGYALYHWWRWRMLHPRIDLDELPKPSSTILPVAAPKSETPEEKKKVVERPPVAAPSSQVAAPVEEKPAEPVSRFHGEDLWSICIRDQDRLAWESGDPQCVGNAFVRARKGRPEYYVRLSQYAWCRGAMIEAHYWLMLARCHGVRGLFEWREQVRQIWVQGGRPNEAENVYAEYPYETAQLARAVMAVCTGIGRPSGMEYIARAASEGNGDALRLHDFLAKSLV